MVGMWMVRPMSLSCTTPGCLAGIISYGHGLMATADLTTVSLYWNEAGHLSMAFCTSLVPMDRIPHGVVPLCTGLQLLPPLPLDTSLKSRPMIPDSFAVFPVAAFAIFMI